MRLSFSRPPKVITSASGVPVRLLFRLFALGLTGLSVLETLDAVRQRTDKDTMPGIPILFLLFSSSMGEALKTGEVFRQKHITLEILDCITTLYGGADRS
jgi:hypothetical protein